MSILSILRARRSVRKFLKKPVPKRLQARLKEACLRAPSSRDIQPWSFHFIENTGLLTQLSQLKPQHAAFLKQAPLAVVVSVEDSECDTWVEDCSVAAMILQLAAEDAGLGSCWVQVHKRHHADGQTSEEFVCETLGMLKTHRVLCVIALGYPASKPKPIPEDKLPWERIWVFPPQ